MLRFSDGFVGSDGVLSFFERFSYRFDGVFQGKNMASGLVHCVLGRMVYAVM